MSCIGLERVFNWWDLLILFSFDFKKFLLFFFCVGHSACLFFLFFQNGSIFIGGSFRLGDRLLNLFMNNIELVTLMNFLKLLLIFLQFEFRLSLFFRLLLKYIRRANSRIHLNSLRRLFLILLSQNNINRLFNYCHVLHIIILQLIFGLNDILFDQLIGLLCDTIL